MAKILLVEDDFSLRDIYSMGIQAQGHDVVTASDGEEALAVAMRERPELIILDVMMPKISGFDVLDILRSTPETKNTKVIMMTALSQDSDRKRGEALGVSKYLVKSQVTLEDVMATVDNVLKGDDLQVSPPTPISVAAPDPMPAPQTEMPSEAASVPNQPVVSPPVPPVIASPAPEVPQSNEPDSSQPISNG